jgi:exodeoxyribonuclease VII small subunit
MTELSALPITGAGDIPADTPFEDAEAELARCVEMLESGEARLDDAVSLLQRGMALHAFCQARLESIRLRIEELAGEPPRPAGEGDPFSPG